MTFGLKLSLTFRRSPLRLRNCVILSVSQGCASERTELLFSLKLLWILIIESPKHVSFMVFSSLSYSIILWYLVIILKQQLISFAQSLSVFMVLKVLPYINRCCAVVNSVVPLQRVPRKYTHTTVIEVKGGDDWSQIPAIDTNLYNSEKPLWFWCK